MHRHCDAVMLLDHNVPESKAEDSQENVVRGSLLKIKDAVWFRIQRKKMLFIIFVMYESNI